MAKVWLKPSLNNKLHYFWIQLTNAISKSWKEELRRSNRIFDAVFVYDHPSIKRNQICSLDKCNSKELYCLQMSLNNSKTRPQACFADLFQNKYINWKHVYFLPLRVTVDANLRIFQHIILHNVLYLNEKLFRYKKISFPLWLFGSLKMKNQYTFFMGALKLICSGIS